MKEIGTAKISRPNATGIIPRKRLFRLLDGLRKQPVVWVAGPAGSGKTSLVASYLEARGLSCLWYQADDRDSDIASFFYYLGLAAKKAAPRYRKPLPLLTPEYLGGIATFTERFFENLYSRLKPPCAVVFDNYQDVPGDSMLQGIVQQALSRVPEGVRVFILSRNELPAPFSRLRANNAIRLVGWDDLRFTLDETEQFVRRNAGLTGEDAGHLHARTEGWAAGLVLLLQGADADKLESPRPGEHLQPEVFEYFAGEVFNKLDDKTRELLVATAFLPTVTTRTAEQMSGFGDAGHILSELNRHNFFTGRISGPSPAYRYHPLFRAFLQTRAAVMKGEDIAGLRIKAAHLLLEEGQIEEAALLFRLAQDWGGLGAVVCGHAREFVSQGRHRPVQEWLASIPETIAAEKSWLLFWSGVCGMPFDPAGSRAPLERAIRIFEERKDESGALLAWSAIVQSCLIEFHDFRPLDPWIDWINERIRRGVSFASPVIEAGVVAGMTGILAWRRHDLPDKEQWLERTLTLPRTPDIAEARMRAYTNCVLYHLWMGEFARCEFLLQEMRAMLQAHAAPPLRRIITKVTEAMLYNSTADGHDQAMAAVSEGLRLAQESGVYLMTPSLYLHGASASLNRGDAKGAEEFLRKMEVVVGERRINLSHYCFLSAWRELFTGESGRAAAFAQRSLRLIEEAGAPATETMVRLVLAHALHETGDHRGARTQLDAARALVLETGSAHSSFLCLLTEAYCGFAQRDRVSGLASLRKAMETGRRNGFATMLYFWRPSVFAGLCAEALEGGIEVEYTKNLIRKLGLLPDERAGEIETWPWPLRITTLGRFEVLKDGKRAGSGRKVQHKPLMLLKALIASGGSEVPEEKITDLLWPDAEGDAAHSAFSTTLHRLRALIRNDKALLLDGRRLTLDPRFCWVDARAFETMQERAETLWRSVDDESGRKREDLAADAVRLGEKALELYRGSFLPGDSREAWTAPYRERLRSKYLRLVLRQGVFLEETSQWRKAAEAFERGIETDELAEEFYQHLMVSYQRLGQKADAIRVYDTCRAVLSSALGISPSKQTEALHSSLLK